MELEPLLLRDVLAVVDHHPVNDVGVLAIDLDVVNGADVLLAPDVLNSNGGVAFGIQVPTTLHGPMSPDADVVDGAGLGTIPRTTRLVVIAPDSRNGVVEPGTQDHQLTSQHGRGCTGLEMTPGVFVAITIQVSTQHPGLELQRSNHEAAVQLLGGTALSTQQRQECGERGVAKSDAHTLGGTPRVVTKRTGPQLVESSLEIIDETQLILMESPLDLFVDPISKRARQTALSEVQPDDGCQSQISATHDRLDAMLAPLDMAPTRSALVNGSVAHQPRLDGEPLIQGLRGDNESSFLCGPCHLGPVTVPDVLRSNPSPVLRSVNGGVTIGAVGIPATDLVDHHLMAPGHPNRFRCALTGDGGEVTLVLPAHGGGHDTNAIMGQNSVSLDHILDSPDGAISHPHRGTWREAVVQRGVSPVAARRADGEGHVAPHRGALNVPGEDTIGQLRELDGVHLHEDLDPGVG